MSALVWMAYVSLLVLGLVDNIRGPFFPEILAELNLTGTVGSLFFAVTSLMAFVGSWSCQFILRSRNSMFIMWFAGFIFHLGFVAVALAQGLFLLLLACAFFGWAFGAWNVGQNLLVVEGAQDHLRRRLLNGLHSMYGAAALLAPILASMFRWFGFDWRDTFLFLSVLPLLMGLWSFRWRGETHARVTSATALRLTPEEWRRCLALALVLSAYLWGELSVTTRLTLWLRTDLDFSPDRANFYQSMFFAGLLGGRIALSFIALQAVSNWVLLSLSGGLSALFFHLGLSVSPEWILVAGVTMAPFFPVAMDQVNEMFGAKSAQALGFVIGFGSLSLVVMHLAVGALTDWAGLTRALQLCAFAQLAACAGVLWLRRQTRLPQT